MSFGNPTSKPKAETPNNLRRMRGLLPYLGRRWLLLNRGRMGHVARESLAESRGIVCINLRVIASTRDSDIGHAAVEQILGAQLGVHVNQDAVGSLSLAGVAGHGIAMVEMRMFVRIEFDCAATVHFQAQPPVFVDALDGSQLAVRNFQFAGRRGELDAVAHWKNSASPRGRRRRPTVCADRKFAACRPPAQPSAGSSERQRPSSPSWILTPPRDISTPPGVTC